MKTKYALFIDIDNVYSEYAACLKLIRDMRKNADLEKILNPTEGLKVAIKIYRKDYKNDYIADTKLEEPLDGKDVLSTLTELKMPELQFYWKKIMNKLHFHIRIHYSNDSMKEYLMNLHYLTLLLVDSEDLINENRLSIFLVPRSSDRYPFVSKSSNCFGETDIELYKEASAHLRAIIQQDKQGVIYGVAAHKKSDMDKIVKALDFKVVSQNVECFPLIVLKSNETYDGELQNYYVNAAKINNKPEFNKDNISKLNHYHLLFDNDIAKIYLNQAINLKVNRRFGFANSRNTNLALADFIFESAYLCLKNKFKQNNEDLSCYIEYINTYLNDASIFAFSIFSFIFDYKNTKNIVENIKDTAEITMDIANALNQIVQNALQHSSEKLCAITFMMEGSKSEVCKGNLKILISDLGNRTILNSFTETLRTENFLLKKLSEQDLVQNITDKTKQEILLTNNRLSNMSLKLENFFNKFDSKNIELNENWYMFRQTDSSAHIGLALFAHIMNKCEGTFNVCSNDKFEFEISNYYSNTERRYIEYNHLVIPGTHFDIALPTGNFKERRTLNMAQLNFRNNYYDNYETYAKYMDSVVKTIDIEENYKSVLNNGIKIVRGNFGVTESKKFSLQFIWADFWVHNFYYSKLGENKTGIYNLDFEKLSIKHTYMNSNRNNEVIIKGLITALGIYCDAQCDLDICLMITNASDDFFKSFEDVTLSLALKKFPDNLQLFITDDSGNKQIHLFGKTYGEAIQNSYIISLEHDTQCYNGNIHKTVQNLFLPFKEYIMVQTRKVFIAPFTAFLKLESKDNFQNVFFDNISKKTEKLITNMEGYKQDNIHIRLGNKVHIDQFYEMSFLFYRTLMANRVAFEILRNIKNSSIDLESDTLLFYGYASYSQAILMSITTILTYYRRLKKSGAKHTYAVYQYNLQSETNANNIQIYYKDYDEFKNYSNIKVVQIVPISSTLTTFEKMWSKFERVYNLKKEKVKHELFHNHTVLWVRDHIEKKLQESTTKNIDGLILNAQDNPITTIENEYFFPPEKGYVQTKFERLKNCPIVHFIFNGYSYWHRPEECKLCYPDKVLYEDPLIETDPTSTVPSQQIYPNEIKSIRLKENNRENNKRIAMLKGFVYYGHICRGKNHYQYYINTQEYFAKVNNQVEQWLIELRNNDDSELKKSCWPCINVIFSPEHNTNVGFSQYVNAYYFNGMAEIISINEDKEFRTNFMCEHAALINTISTLFQKYYSVLKDNQDARRYLPVRFYFADDDIISGTTMRKASSLLQSLIPKEYLELYTTSVFEKCFFLIDRISESTKASYVIPTNKFYSFCHIDVSNMRKQGDSCIGCKLLGESTRLMHRSATHFSCNYWSSKVKGYLPKSFEEIAANNNCELGHYYRFVLSHIVKNLYSYNTEHSEKIYFDMILGLFDYFLNEGSSYFKNKYYDDICELSEGLIEVGVDKKLVIESLLKIMTRPFFTYNHSVKRQTLRVLILLSEKIINVDFDKLYEGEINKYTIILNAIIRLFKDKKYGLLDFLQNYLFEAFTDMHSTYLIRKNTMLNAMMFTKGLEYELSKSESEKEKKEFDSRTMNFWRTYAVYVQKIVDGSSDETRTLWLERLLITGNEINTGDKNNYSRKIECFYDYTRRETKYDSEAIEMFCKEIFLSNGHLLTDGLKQLCNIKGKVSDISDEYFMRRWHDFRKIDEKCFDGEIITNSNIDYSAERELYEHLMPMCLDKKVECTIPEKCGNNLIIKRYKALLKKIRNMVMEKYSIHDYDAIRLAILTRGENLNKEAVYHRDLEMITYLISSDNTMDNAKSKYIIKTRIIEALKKHKLDQNGYYMELASIKSYREGQYKNEGEKNFEYNLDHRKPYFIIRFDTSEDMLNANKEMRRIVPVYLYISILISKKEERRMLPWLIMRDILCYRDSIMRYLVEDFTSDVIQRYAHTIGTEAILQHEKAMSHSPMNDDKQLLDRVFEKDSPSKVCGELTNETMLKWISVRNYCNTIIAKLYNRVFRNINKTFDEIVQESEERSNREVTKLYVPISENDGNSIPILSLVELLPNVEDDILNEDPIFKLFKEIIEFKINISNEQLCQLSIITKKDKNGIDYTYNLDYTKNIIYRICFDALRFSYGAGAGVNDFYWRIVCHYEYICKQKLYHDSEKEGYAKDILSKYEKNYACEVVFQIEDSNSSKYNWLVIKNKLSLPLNITEDEIKSKLTDPLDFTDGHMSLLTEKEYIAKLLDEDEEYNLNNEIFGYDNGYFVTRLPIIKKNEISR